MSIDEQLSSPWRSVRLILVLCAVAVPVDAQTVMARGLLVQDPIGNYEQTAELLGVSDTSPESEGLLRLANVPHGDIFRRELTRQALQPTDSGQETIQEEARSDAGSEGLAKKLANPISDLISVPLQFNYDEGFGPKDASRVTLNVQPVIPFAISANWNLITRTIVPVIYQEPVADGRDSEFALGDTLQSFFLSPKEPVKGWILGGGPVVLWPTGTEPTLRSESLGLGPTFVALKQEGGWTYGALGNHVWSITHSDDYPDVNATFVQPFLAYTWPTATTVTLNTEMTYDWNNEEWNVPVNLLLGQILNLGGQPVSFQLGGKWYAESPEGGPEWGVRFVFTFLFPK